MGEGRGNLVLLPKSARGPLRVIGVQDQEFPALTRVGVEKRSYRLLLHMASIRWGTWGAGPTKWRCEKVGSADH